MYPLAYILWQLNPVLAQPFGFELRWYGLCFVLGFLFFPTIGRAIFARAGKNPDDLERAIHYVMLGTILGARLGHVFFYEATYYLQHPLEILLPIRNIAGHWKFTGYQGLASHGATIGILTSIYLFTRRYPAYTFRWFMTPLSIGVALGGASIRMGNFTNSEIYGKPTTSKVGVFFARPVINYLQESNPKFVDHVQAKRLPDHATTHRPQAAIALTLTNRPHKEEDVHYFIKGSIKAQLAAYREHVRVPLGAPLDYALTKNAAGAYVATLTVPCVPRHASQLYEALSCLLLFFLLLLRWRHSPHTIRPGSYAGFFLIYVFGLRFFYEFFKTSNVPFPALASLTTPQWLSLPTVLVGILFLVFSAPAPGPPTDDLSS